MKIKFGRKLWVFVFACGSGSEREDTGREAFWNYLNVSVVLFGDLYSYVGDVVVEYIVDRHGLPWRN